MCEHQQLIVAADSVKPPPVEENHIPGLVLTPSQCMVSRRVNAEIIGTVFIQEGGKISTRGLQLKRDHGYRFSSNGTVKEIKHFFYRRLLAALTRKSLVLPRQEVARRRSLC